MSLTKSYQEAIQFQSLQDRYKYLRIGGVIGQATFGFDRFLNQGLYRSTEWQKVRRDAMVRDNACDLAVPGYDIYDKVLVHHINPITLYQLESGDRAVFDLDNLICSSFNTHQAIHFGNESLLPKELVNRTPNDTSPWRQNGR